MTVSAPSGPLPPAARPCARPAPTDGFAIAALICAVVGLNIVAVVLGHVSLAVIGRTGGSGAVMAVIALVIGYLSLAAIALVALVAVGAIGWAVSLP
ncbi:DUF4190 domain-containing protein [Leucobacter zeae]|nr:DUF4190 domain-containing protein [Leucobacter zeae]